MNQLTTSALSVILLLWIISTNNVFCQNTTANNDNEQNQEQNNTSKYITNSQPFTDKRDGKSYKTIKIGKQIWMAENLAHKTKSGCWCYNDNESMIIDHGYLYNWQTAKNVCPDGWRLPKRTDFEQLMFMVSKISKKPSREIITGGCSGFEALQSGWRSEDGLYFDMFENGNFWTSSKSISGRSWLLFVGKKGKKSYMDFAPYDTGMSVRCIKEE